MDLVNVRMQVSKVTIANVSYISKRLGIPKKATYALIVDLFMFERQLDAAFRNLSYYRSVATDPASTKNDDDVPF